MKHEKIGSCSAVLASISTKVDGSVKLVLDIMPQDKEILSRLMERFLIGENLYEVGIIGVKHE